MVGTVATDGKKQSKPSVPARYEERGKDLWPGRLELIIGAQVMVLKNQQTQSGIVNGMMAELVDVVLLPTARVRFESHLSTAGTGGGVHTVNYSDVSALILRYCDIKWRERNIFDSLPPGCFPLVCTKSILSTKCWINMPGGRQHLNVTQTQFPCSPAFAITGHKVQGQTLDQLIVGSWRPSTSKGKAPAVLSSLGADGYLYVLLSRVRSIANLYILNPLPTDLWMYPTRVSVRDELKRLAVDVFEPTLRRLQAMEQNNAGAGVDGMAAAPSSPAIPVGGNRSDSVAFYGGSFWSR